MSEPLSQINEWYNKVAPPVFKEYDVDVRHAGDGYVTTYKVTASTRKDAIAQGLYLFELDNLGDEADAASVRMY